MLPDAPCRLATGGGLGGRQLTATPMKPFSMPPASWSSTPSPTSVRQSPWHAGRGHRSLSRRLRRGARHRARGLSALRTVNRIGPRVLTGAVAELRAPLDCMVSEALHRSVRWPKAPNALSNAIRRMATHLRAAGIELQFSRNDEQGRRIVSVLGAAQVRKTSSVIVSDRQSARGKGYCLEGY